MNAPAPAGPAAGPLAARAGAAAAVVVAEVAREDGAGAVAAQAEALVRRLEQLATADEAAFATARAALAGTRRSTAPTDAGRRFEVARALERAGDVPLRIAEACADVVTLARGLAPDVGHTHAADLEACALLAIGAARAAAHLVESNLAAATGDDRVARARAAAGAE